MQQSNRLVQTLVVLLVILASALLLSQVWTFLLQFSNIFYLFFVSWLLAFILRPLAKWLSSRGLPYGVAIGIVYLLLGLVLTVSLLALIPEIVKQVTNFTNNFDSEADINARIQDAQNLINSWGVPALLESWNIREEELGQFYVKLGDFAQQTAGDLLTGTLAFAQGLAVFFFQLILVLLLSFYFMKDGERISASIVNLLPPKWQDEMRLVGYSIERSFGGFIRGQLVFALIYGVLTAILMLVPPFSLNDLALIASIAAGTCMLIPLIGNLLSFIPPMLALLITPGKADLWLWFFLILFVMQSIMMNVLAPRIMSSAIGIHPMYVWAAILIGGQVAGIWGALFGIPIAGAINLVGRPVMRRIRHTTSLYKEVPGSSVTTSAYLTGPLAAAMAEGRISPDAVPPGVLPESAPVQDVPAPTPAATPLPPSTPAPAPTTRPAPSAATGAMSTSMLPTLPDDDDDIVMRPSPTLTAKAWRLAFVVLSRARKGAWERVQDRVGIPPPTLAISDCQLRISVHLLVLAGYALLTFFMTLPLPLELGSEVPGGGDAWQHIWNLWWVKDALLHGHNPYYTDLLYYPDGVNLYFHTLVLTAGLIGIPLQLLGLNLITTYNLILLSSFVLAGYSTFLLCHYLLADDRRRMTGDGRELAGNTQFAIRNIYWASFVGGIVFAFAPYHFAHAYGHMNLISVQWMPFYVLLLLKAIDSPHVQSPKSKVESLNSGSSDEPGDRNVESRLRNFGLRTLESGLRASAGAGALLAVNAYTDWTYAAYLLLLTALVLLWRVLRRSERELLREKGVTWRQGGLRLLAGLGVFSVLVSPILFPTLAEAQRGYAQQDGYETLVYSSDLSLAFTPSELHPIWGKGIEEHVENLGPYLPLKNPSERTVFLGYTVLALALIGGWRLRKVGHVRFWLFAALVAWVLSLGPLLQIGGETAFTGFKVSYPMPYLLFFDLPFFSIMRSPSRLTVLVMLSLAVLVAYVVAHLLGRVGRQVVGKRKVWRTGGSLFVWIIIPALIIFEFLAALDTVPPGWDVPIYRKIAEEPGRFALLELPLRPFGDYMAYQTVHEKPIVGGYLSRQPPYPTRDNTPVLRYLLPATNAADPLRDQVVSGKGVQTLREMEVKYIIIRWWAFNADDRVAMEVKLANILGNRPPDFHYKKDQVDVWQLYP